jgi:hypothetical protein
VTVCSDPRVHDTVVTAAKKISLRTREAFQERTTLASVAEPCSFVSRANDAQLLRLGAWTARRVWLPKEHEPGELLRRFRARW